jgi:hypothetical protein
MNWKLLILILLLTACHHNEMTWHKDCDYTLPGKYELYTSKNNGRYIWTIYNKKDKFLIYNHSGEFMQSDTPDIANKSFLSIFIDSCEAKGFLEYKVYLDSLNASK